MAKTYQERQKKILRLRKVLNNTWSLTDGHWKMSPSESWFWTCKYGNECKINLMPQYTKKYALNSHITIYLFVINLWGTNHIYMVFWGRYEYDTNSKLLQHIVADRIIEFGTSVIILWLHFRKYPYHVAGVTPHQITEISRHDFEMHL